VRIELLGGGGVRVPHLVYRLLGHREELDLEEILLYDLDRHRAEAMAGLCGALARRKGVDLPLRVIDAPGTGGPVDFVLTAIRPGLDRARARDEEVCRGAGVLGQETTGAGGFFMALRTIGPLVDEVLRSLETSPDAWVLNFTNPAGIMTEALAARGVTRAAGLCDTPSHLLAEIESGLGVASGDLTPSYVGLNHMGFFTGLVDRQGVDRLPEILDRYEEMRERIDSLRYFSPEVVRAIGNLPVEYVHFYLDRRGSVARQAATPVLRGGQIEALNRRLWAAVEAAPGASEAALGAYLEVMATRSATYLAAETGESRHRSRDPEAYLEHAGYEVIAIAAMRALRGGPAATLMLDVMGGGASLGADPGEVYEASVRVDATGLTVLPVAPPGPVARSLIEAVKTYERLTRVAQARPSRAALLAALLAHPLIGDGPVAGRLLDLAAGAGVEGVAGIA